MAKEIVPTCVGVNRKKENLVGFLALIVPTCVGVNRWTHGSTPTKRGIVPTCVGVNRKNRAMWPSPSHRPHVRGGEPLVGYATNLEISSSPRAWG